MRIFDYEIDDNAVWEAIGGVLLAVLGVYAYGRSESEEGKAASALLAMHGASYAGDGIYKAISSAKPVQREFALPTYVI